MASEFAQQLLSQTLSGLDPMNNAAVNLLNGQVKAIDSNVIAQQVSTVESIGKARRQFMDPDDVAVKDTLDKLLAKIAQ